MISWPLGQDNPKTITTIQAQVHAAPKGHNKPSTKRAKSATGPSPCASPAAKMTKTDNRFSALENSGVEDMEADSILSLGSRKSRGPGVIKHQNTMEVDSIISSGSRKSRSPSKHKNAK